MRVLFENSSGDALCGIFEDAGRATDAPSVILCHGFSSQKNNSTHTRLAPLLAAQGIASFRFDFFGHGESGGKFEHITLSEAIDDLEHALATVRGKGYAQVGLLGASFGGMVAFLFAARHPELFAVVLKCPVSDYLGKIVAQQNRYPLTDWKEQGYLYYTRSHGEKLRLNYSFFEDAKIHSGYAAAPKLTMLTLIIHGDADTTVPIEQSKKMASLIPNCKLEIIPGADHWFSQPEHFERMIGLITTFFVEQASH